jgi:phage terminase large subunit-like protein
LVRKNATGFYESSVDEDAQYFAGLDTSTYGNDWTAFIVLKYKDDKYSVVALYRKRQQTSDYHIYQIGELINLYQPDKIGIETTGGVGTLYLEQLSKEHKSIKFDAIKTTNDTKSLMISTVVLALEKGVLNYPSNSPLIEEMLNFRRQGIKLESAPGKHDDSIMALSFSLAVTNFNKGKSIWNI